jgi:Helix-turn-helix domain
MSYCTDGPAIMSRRRLLLDTIIFFSFGKDKFCWASNATLMRVTGLKLSTIKRYLTWFEENGLMPLRVLLPHPKRGTERRLHFNFTDLKSAIKLSEYLKFGAVVLKDFESRITKVRPFEYIDNHGNKALIWAVHAIEAMVLGNRWFGKFNPFNKEMYTGSLLSARWRGLNKRHVATELADPFL